jgi:hypothetical protein
MRVFEIDRQNLEGYLLEHAASRICTHTHIHICTRTHAKYDESGICVHIHTHVAVSFWTAAVNWRLAGETRYTMMREVFSKHKKLKELLEWMIRRVDRKDEVCASMRACVHICTRAACADEQNCTSVWGMRVCICV